MRALLHYFAKRNVVANVLLFGLISMAVLFWEKMGKEEMPEFSMEWVRVMIRYPGASAEDVELFVTKPIEEKLKGLTGVEQIQSTSSYGSSSFRISFEARISNLQEKIQEVKDAVNSSSLPRETDDPVFRQFRSSTKAIIDIGVFLKNKEILGTQDRIELQEYALAFKNKLLGLSQISGVESSGYLRPELQVKVRPEDLERFDISMDQVKEQILSQNVRRPVGSLEDEGESDVTVLSQLEDVSSLEEVTLSSGFQSGRSISLKNVAVIERGFEKVNRVDKVQGHEGLVFNVQKSSNTDILTAQEVVVDFIEEFQSKNRDLPVDFILMDDESYDVRNRLGLIGTNGAIGFILIVFVLFLFLDFKSGIWVAMGIPFSLGFTLLMAMAMGYTINNMTLAAIIIVLGIVVDDAIIVAENISRKWEKGDLGTAIDAVMEVLSPVLASVLTTCVAFLPMYFFSGHFGLFVKYLPTIIMLMLAASLIESFFILPAHMTASMNFGKTFFQNRLFESIKNKRSRLTARIEGCYERWVRKALSHRFLVLSAFVLLLAGAGLLFTSKMKYVMFPREESRDFRVQVQAADGVGRYQMAKKIRPIEDLFLSSPYVTAVRSGIGQSRRGGEVKENSASIRVEILPANERELSLNQLFRGWQEKLDAMEGFDEIKLQRSRWGFDGGSPIVIEVRENNNTARNAILESLREKMEQMPELTSIEVEKPVTKREYALKIKKEKASRLGVSFEKLASVLRSYIEGDVLYTINSGEEEVDLRFTSHQSHKDSIEDILSLTVANKNNYLVPLSSLVDMEVGKKPSNIERINFKRSMRVYADLKEGTKKTPIEIAEFMEKNVFPEVSTGYPSAVMMFRGEVEDTRESQSDFKLSVIMVLVLIFVLLVFLFDSVVTPFLIAAIIPFGAVGIVFAFWLHGLTQFGFFAAVGALGMVGVVINDSIVLIDRLKKEQSFKSFEQMLHRIAEVSSTRLRAVVVTTLTTIAGLFPTAYGLGGYDSMLAEMMLSMGWGLLFGMFITLVLVPCLYSLYAQIRYSPGKVSS